MAPESLLNMAHAQEQASLVGVGRCAKRSAKLLGATALFALLASPFPLANAAESSQRMAQEEHACAVVMGLQRPGDLYDTCIRSLEKTLSGLDQARLAATQQSACALEGKAGTSGYAVCVLNAEQSSAEINGFGANTY